MWLPRKILNLFFYQFLQEKKQFLAYILMKDIIEYKKEV